MLPTAMRPGTLKIGMDGDCGNERAFKDPFQWRRAMLRCVRWVHLALSSVRLSGRHMRAFPCPPLNYLLHLHPGLGQRSESGHGK